jgi:hypothetical protein
MPTGAKTFCTEPPHPGWRFRGASLKVWYTSNSSPHLVQEYAYVGIRFDLVLVRRAVSEPLLALAPCECHILPDPLPLGDGGAPHRDRL